MLWWAEMNNFFAIFKATQHPIGVMVITIPALFGMPSPTASFAGGSLSICYIIIRMFQQALSVTMHGRKLEMFQGFENHNN